MYRGGLTGILLLIIAADAAHLFWPDILSSQDDVNKLKEYILRGDGRHATFERLAFLGDSFGSRMSGSQGLENATDYAVKVLTSEGFSVHTEKVTVAKWVRGEESAELLINGRTISMKILGLGTSIGTTGVTAEVIVVRSFSELDAVKDKVRGRIVVYNEPWTGYGSTVAYRSSGAARASSYGAKAALVRSVTPLSIYSPHTGMQDYGKAVPIPVACITVEDAEMLQRLQDRGANFSIHLRMDAKTVGESIQRNIVAEIQGTLYPQQTVIFGGHFDSWDVGTGSMDDGGGAMIAWQALSAIKKLNLTVKRTIRLVLWTAEEQGVIGGQEYFNQHKAEKDNISLVLESDMGAFKPMGLQFSGSSKAGAILQQMLNLLADVNVTTLLQGDGGSSDTDVWVNVGVPGATLLSHNENYFYYHHSNGDTMTVLNADDLDLCTLLWATTVLTVSNLDELLPR